MALGAGHALTPRAVVVPYVARRLGVAVLLAWGVASLAFVLVWFAPGDVRGGLLLESDAAAAAFGDEAPGLLEGYAAWLGGVVRGDLGRSQASGRAVSRILGDALPHTLALSVAALILALGLGVGVGVAQAARAASPLDRALGFATAILYSAPSFWVGILLAAAFVRFPASLGWGTPLPLSGVAPAGGAAGPWDYVPYLVLPALTLGLVLGAGVARFTRAAMLEILGQDYIRAARARGVGEAAVILRHGLRNALLPLVSLVGIYLPMLLTGAVFVEAVFERPGVGREMLLAISRQDTPVVVGGALLFGVAAVGASLLADLLYGWVDPRIADAHRG